MGLKARDDSKQFAFINDKPAPLQLERIEEDAALQGAHAEWEGGAPLWGRSVIARSPSPTCRHTVPSLSTCHMPQLAQRRPHSSLCWG